jgi:hypothetical protein
MNVLTGGTVAPVWCTDRARVSTRRTWLVNISPATGKPDGNTTLVGNGRTREVIGQAIARPMFRVKAVGESTKAGRRPIGANIATYTC